MAEKNKQLVLGYWNIRGLAQSIRLLLHYTKTPFTDKMYTQGEPPEYSREEWLSEKQTLGLDFPNLPYLFDDDVKITQSKAILYYLGRKLGMTGSTPEEEARIFMLCEEAYDMHIPCAIFCYGPNGGSDTERKKFVETTLTESLKKFDNYLDKNKGKFLVGNQITIADFRVYALLDMCFLIDDENTLPKKFGNIKQYLEMFDQLPELKDYIEKSRRELPLNGPNAKFGGKVIERK